MNDLDKKIDQKTAEAILALESLALEGEPHNYDFDYNTIHTNYDISSYRQKIDEFSKKYLARVKKENDAFLANYLAYIEELKSITTPTIENNKQVFASKTSPLKLKIVIDNYDTPQLYLEFKPSQKEPVLETLRFSNKNTNVFFDKQDNLINNYNVSSSKIITFNLLDPNSRINLTNFKQLIEDNAISIDLKWFYEPEKVNVSKKSINSIKDVLSLFEKLFEEYKANQDNIYVPKYVK